MFSGPEEVQRAQCCNLVMDRKWTTVGRTEAQPKQQIYSIKKAHKIN